MMSWYSDATLASVNGEGGREESKKEIDKKVGSFDLWTGLAWIIKLQTYW